MRAQRSAAVRIFSAAACVAGIALLLEQHRPRDDDRQRIVELVRDAGQQRAERGELLALVQRFALPRQLLRRALLLGDVAGDGQHVRLALVLHRDAVHLELQREPSLRCSVTSECSDSPAATERRNSGRYDGPAQRPAAAPRSSSSL